MEYVTKHRQRILNALDYIWKNPETGYKEWKTHAYLAKEFRELGYALTEAGNIPGFTALADTGRPGPTVAVFGELDALICESHPDADPETGAVHSCGHCAQAAALLGLAAALKEPGAMDGMDGKVLLVAVPAEELIEVEYRQELYKQGIIRYFGGKPEFMRRGLLDGVDMAFMIHTSNGNGLSLGSNGCIAKTMEFEGLAAHAGGAPHRGINALYAANLALMAANSLRETFRDEDHIRFHPIITQGGDAVNAIPDKVKMESYVRGATMDAIAEANRRINRAMAGAAVSMGAKVRLQDIPGYWPRKHPDCVVPVVRDAMMQVLGEFKRGTNWPTGCSDMGDIGAVMPAIHPHIAGSTGNAHSNSYRIADPETACVKSAEVQLVMLQILLKNGGEEVQKIVREYDPEFKSKEEYFAFVDKLALDKEAVTYEDGRVILDFENQ